MQRKALRAEPVLESGTAAVARCNSPRRRPRSDRRRARAWAPASSSATSRSRRTRSWSAVTRSAISRRRRTSSQSRPWRRSARSRSCRPNAATGTPATATCCTSDITLAEFKQLCGKMDGSNPKATTPEEFQHGTPSFRTDLYATCGTVMSHDDYIDLVDHLGRNFTPELNPERCHALRRLHDRAVRAEDDRRVQGPRHQPPPRLRPVLRIPRHPLLAGPRARPSANRPSSSTRSWTRPGASRLNRRHAGRGRRGRSTSLARPPGCS